VSQRKVGTHPSTGGGGTRTPPDLIRKASALHCVWSLEKPDSWGQKGVFGGTNQGRPRERKAHQYRCITVKKKKRGGCGRPTGTRKQRRGLPSKEKNQGHTHCPTVKGRKGLGKKKKV